MTSWPNGRGAETGTTRFVDGFPLDSNRERKCADTIGLVWPFPMLKYEYIFQIHYTEAIYQTTLGNCSGLKLQKC